MPDGDPRRARQVDQGREERLAGAFERARKRAGDFLNQAGVTLETKRDFVDNAFLLEQVFRDLMTRADARAITINHCMGTIMPISDGSRWCEPGGEWIPAP